MKYKKCKVARTQSNINRQENYRLQHDAMPIKSGAVYHEIAPDLKLTALTTL